MERILRELNILILTHYFAHGPAYDLEYYLKGRVRNLTVIEIPLYLKSDSLIKIQSYNRNSKPIYLYKEINTITPLYAHTFQTMLEILVRFAHYIITMINELVEELRYDIAITEDPMTAFLAMILRKMGKVKYVIFQSHAYTAPERGSIYKFIDYYVTRNSDIVWALSNRLAEIRKALGAKHVLHTPVCIRDDVVDCVNRYPEEKENAIVYIGALNKDKGVDILLRLIPPLVRIFDKVYIVGEGPYREIIEKLSASLKNKVKYLGRLPLKQSMQIAKKSLLGLVLTKPSLELLTTDPMKPKVYIASHTPLTIPEYFELSNLVDKFSAGLIIHSLNKDHVMKRILEFLKKRDDYIEGARNMAKYFNYWRCSTMLKDVIEKTMYLLKLI